MKTRSALGAVLLAGTLSASAPALAAEGFQTSVKPYATPTPGSPYTITPLLSAADRVPRTGGNGQYQMVGIPDGLGATREGARVSLFMNHELGNTVLSEPNVGGPRNRGAFVSEFKLAADGSVLSGRRAYDRVYKENAYFGPAAQEGNSTPGFGRFCSGNLAGEEVAFDRPVYLTNEESGGSGSFDGRGGQSVAIAGGNLYTLPKLGRFNKENSVPMPKTGKRTVIYSLEDGPAGPESQLWMYVGYKQSKGSVLSRNGLDNGSLYVFVVDGASSEADFKSGTRKGRWVRIANADALDENQLEAAADAAGAFGFVRIEDGAASKTDQKKFYFNTTGGTPGVNALGRTYELSGNPGNPTQPAKLTVVQNADQIVAAGGDTAVSPDNMDTSDRYLMVNEDGTAESRPVMAQKDRDGSIWRFNLRNDFGRARVAELDPPGRDGVPVGPGEWETSGTIDASGLYGGDSWLFDVQAHPPTAAPNPGVVEDGQLLLMRRAR